MATVESIVPIRAQTRSERPVRMVSRGPLHIALIGIGLGIPLAAAYLNNNLALTGANAVQDHLAVTGLAFGIAGAQLFVFVLLLHGAVVATTRSGTRW